MGAIERHYGERAPAGLHKGLARIAKLLDDDYAEHAKVIKRIRALTGDAGADALPKSKDPWTQALREASRTPLAGDALALAAGATAAKPTKAFLAERDAAATSATVGRRSARSPRSCSAPPPQRRALKGQGVPSPVGDVLRGLAWIAGGAGGEDAARALAAMALAGWQEGPLARAAVPEGRQRGARPRSPSMPEGAAELGRLRAQLKRPSAVRAVEAAIAKASERTRDRARRVRGARGAGLRARRARPVALGEHVAELTLRRRCAFAPAPAGR